MAEASQLLDSTVTAEPLELPDDTSRDGPSQANQDQPTHQDLIDVWKFCNLLTFDGGGIRGYWSLLAMRQLMDHVYAVEMHHKEGEHLHSFCPLPYPPFASQVRLTSTEERYGRVHYKDDGIEALDPARRYLPCHYFDLIGGTSTGALIALMLGRLRMSVLDGLYEYAHLGKDVFGNPGSFAKARILLTKGTKHSTADAEKAFKDVAKSRTEWIGKNDPLPRFPSSKHMCHTFTTSLLSAQNDAQSKRFIFRSYDNPTDVPAERQPALGRLRKRTFAEAPPVAMEPSNSQPKSKRTYEPAHDYQIYEIARGATAVPKVFKPMKIKNARDETMTLEDAGVVMPNPTQVGLREIHRIHGKDNVGVVVSVGTAKANYVQEKDIGDESVIGTGERMASVTTNPQEPHHEVEADLQGENPHYYRLDPKDNKHRLTIVMDQWEPRKATDGERSGERTLSHMKQRFDDWYQSNPEIGIMYRKIAEELVQRRRLRARNTAKWERYIKGSHFMCPFDECRESQRKFTFRDQFVDHCREHPTFKSQPEEQLLKIYRHEGWLYQERTTKVPWSI